MRILLTCLLCACSAARPAPTWSGARWQRLAAPGTADYRGLSVVSDQVFWASGTKGTWLRSLDGGATFQGGTVPGAEALDFRSLHAFDAQSAVLLSAGEPARVYATVDGGAHWTLRREITTQGIFFDSLAFWSARDGIALGDALAGRFAGMVTHDGGQTWEDAPGPAAQEGEGGFAASNTCIALTGEREAWYAATGRIFHSRDGGASWSAAAHGLPSSATAGVFSIAFRDSNLGYAAGGDYKAPAAPGSFSRTTDGGATWTRGAAPRGYRSVVAIAGSALLVAGTSGSDLSIDDGATWTTIGDEAINTVAGGGAGVFAAGPKGALYQLHGSGNH